MRALPTRANEWLTITTQGSIMLWLRERVVRLLRRVLNRLIAANPDVAPEFFRYPFP